MNPAPTPAPLHDIVGPVALPGLPPWVYFAAVVLVLAAGLVLLAVFRPRRASRQALPPRERALAALENLRRENPGSYTLGVKASDILRGYIRDQFGLDATTRTSFEFLQALQEHPAFSLDERAALAGFLEAADLLKFARAEAEAGEREQMLETAVRLVQGAGAPRPTP